MSLTDKMNLDKTDPWLAWCSPVHNAATQPWLLDYPEQCKWFKRDSAEFLEYMKESFALKHLIVATDEITSKSRDIVPEVPDVKHHPVPSLNFNFYTGERSTYSYDPIMIFLDDLLDDSTHSPNLFRNLLMFAIAWPHPQAVEQLKKLAPIVIQLLMAAHRFLLKKIALAKTMGLKRAAKKLEDADKNFCMIDLTGNIDKDAEQLFLVKKITPDAFRAAMRSAFKLDREATDEINGVENATPTPQQVATATIELAPHYSKLLQQAADNSAAAKKAAEQTAIGISAASEKIDALSDWLKDWRKHAPHINRNNPPRTQTSSTVRNKIVGWWEEYQSEPIDNSPKLPAINRKTKRAYEEFINAWGEIKKHEKQTLNQLLDDAKNGKESRVETLRRLVNSAQKFESRQQHKNPAQN